MTSPHDDVPQEPAWASPTGPGPDAAPPAPPVAAAPPGYPAYGQPVPPPGYPQQPPAYGQQPPPPGWGGPPPGAPGWGQPVAPPPGASWRPPALQPGIIPLRPIGLGEIYDGAFRAIRANPKVMFGMAAIVVTVAVILQSLISWYVEGLVASQFTDLAHELDPQGVAGLDSSLSTGVGQLSGLPITALATTVLTGLLIVSVSRSVLGQVVTVRDVLRGGRVWLVVAFSLLLSVAVAVVVGIGVGAVALLGVSGNVGAAILLGAVALLVYVVGAFWVSVRTLLVAPALMLEGKGFWSTVGRAWRLTRGTFWRLLGIWLLTSILANIISAIFTVPAQLFTQLFLGDTDGRSFGAIAISGVADVISLTLSTTFVAAVTALLYIDVRMRREGLDDPELPGTAYFDLAAAVKQRVPGMHVHAFSPMEIVNGSSRTGLSFEDFLIKARESGLDTIPGTAAEILDDEVRWVLTKGKLPAQTWIDIVSTAHRVGIRSSSTMMYGHVDNPRHWVGHLKVLARIQDTALDAGAGGFTEFVPLPFVHHSAPIYLAGVARPGPSQRDNLAVHAMARIMLHGRIPNIQTSWVKLGVDGTRAMLRAGANDVGGTLMEETISRMAGSEHGSAKTVAELEEIGAGIGRPVVQRTTTYAAVDRPGRPT